jgi:hypothetical protein
LSTRQYARLVGDWIRGIGLDPCQFGTHSLRRSKATLIYRRTGNLRAVLLLLGHTKIESTVRDPDRRPNRQLLTTPDSRPEKMMTFVATMTKPFGNSWARAQIWTYATPGPQGCATHHQPGCTSRMPGKSLPSTPIQRSSGESRLRPISLAGLFGL